MRTPWSCCFLQGCSCLSQLSDQSELHSCELSLHEGTLQLLWSAKSAQGSAPGCRYGHTLTSASNALWSFGGRTERFTTAHLSLLLISPFCSPLLAAHIFLPLTSPACHFSLLLTTPCRPLLLTTLCRSPLLAVHHFLLLTSPCCSPLLAAHHSLPLTAPCCSPSLLLTAPCCSPPLAAHHSLLLTAPCSAPLFVAHLSVLFSFLVAHHFLLLTLFAAQGGRRGRHVPGNK